MLGGQGMQSVTGERILTRLQDLGISQAELARRADLAQSTVNGLVTGRSQSSAHLHVIARILGVSTAWLAGDTDAEPYPRIGASSGGLDSESRELLAEQLDVELLPMVDFFSLGEGASLSVLHQVPVSREWLRDIIADSASGQVVVGKNEGDAMLPTIAPGDIVVVDQAKRSVQHQDRIWALAYGRLGMIKRVRALPDGSFQLLSDNPAVAPIIANENDFTLLGRVEAVVKRV
jgi:phage repressor protein C with HTH and peptisase S24 domain